MNIMFPNRNGVLNVEYLEFNSPLVIVGANGSGKSRLGVWLDQHNTGLNIHRISAHRALNVPDFAAVKSLEESLNELLFGTGQLQNASPQLKFGTKWQNKPATHLQNDYDRVLTTLFALSSKRNSDYVKACQQDTSGKQLPIPPSAIEILVDIWKSILPHRQIELEDSRVTVKVEGMSYHGKEMSDGERVALYLIGQCLAIPKNSILIIDEPELHLHKSLMNRLWNKIEEVRNDCKFIYITHDLDFAATRTKATKIWVKTFNPDTTWTWEEVPEINELPELLILEIIGSRKPILFVECEKGSYDYEIYQHVFPEYTIIPRGGSSKVIESTKALRANSSIHTINANGLIDRDYHSNDELEILKNAGISVVDVAEIENLFCIPQIIDLVAQNQAMDIQVAVNQATEFVINELSNDFERQVSFRSALEINYRLNAYNQKAQGKEGLKNAIGELVNAIDVDSIYDRNLKLYQDIIDKKDLVGALKFYTNKGLLSNISKVFGLRSKEYAGLIIRLLKTDKKDKIIDAFKLFIPELTKSETVIENTSNITKLDVDVLARQNAEFLESQQSPIVKISLHLPFDTFEKVQNPDLHYRLHIENPDFQTSTSGMPGSNQAILHFEPNTLLLKDTADGFAQSIIGRYSQLKFTKYELIRKNGEIEIIHLQT